jgi:TonB family protein
MADLGRVRMVLAGLVVLSCSFPAGTLLAAPSGRRLADPSELAARASNVRVERMSWDEAAANERTGASAKASREWLQRLLAAGLRESERRPDSLCAVACRRCPEQLRVEVHFTVERKRGRRGEELPGQPYLLTLNMREGLAFLRSDVAATWGFQDSLGAVLDLIREVMPDDVATARWQAPAPPPPALDVDSAAEADHDLTVVGLPEAITKVAPHYPEVARAEGVSGVVDVRALVAADGSVERVRVSRSVRQLDQAALDAVSQWRFKPAVCDGHAVAVWVTVPVRFTLR